MLPEIAPSQLADALDELAAELLAAAGVRQPPVDALAMAGSLGIVVAWDERQRERARLVRLGGYLAHRDAPIIGERGDREPIGDSTEAGQVSILLRPEARRERRHWAVAHEIGEAHAYQVFARLNVDPAETSGDAREMVANYLASRLLLPTAWFRHHAVQCEWDLFELKRQYATASHELIARRMLDFDIPVIITIFDHGRITLRRGNQAGGSLPMLPWERECRRRVAESKTACRESRFGCQVQGWPIYEPDWRREILRTHIDPVADCWDEPDPAFD